MAHAAVGYWQVREGRSATPWSDMATVWVLTLTSLTVAFIVMGSFLRMLAQLRH